MTATEPRALFERSPRFADIVPFAPLADGLPTPVEQLRPGLLVQRDDLTSSVYGGNKVRKLEFVLPIAVRRGGPVITAGAEGSHHVLATTIHGSALGVHVEAVRYPQRDSDDAFATARRFEGFLATRSAADFPIGSPYLMPIGLARRMMRTRRRRATFVWPGASTPLGGLGHVSAGLELVQSCETAGLDPPDEIVVALGSGSTAVGLAVGIALGGWRTTRVRAVRVTDRIVTNHAVLAPLEHGIRLLLALGGLRPPRAKLTIDGRWLGQGYTHPTTAGDEASAEAAGLGLELEPTYTAKAFACALDRHRLGGRVLFVQTSPGRHA